MSKQKENDILDKYIYLDNVYKVLFGYITS